MDNATPNMPEDLVRLLDNELTPEEKAELESRLAADLQLQQDFDSLLCTRAAIRHYGLQQQVSAIHLQMMEEMNEQPVKRIAPVRKMFRYSAAVAAGILLIVGGFFAYQFFTLTPGKVFSAHYQSFELTTVRGTLNESAVEKAFRDKNYTEVIRLHDAGTEPGVKAEFLNGAAALELKDNTRAITSFNRVISLNKEAHTTGFQDEAEYYLALSYIAARDYKSALGLLKKIGSDPQHLYNSKVTNGLIRQVRMLSWQ
ncbi:MAG: hypothetical protein HYZ15_11060 [Sphingobacteriales bacterium]|nr:hypothetical protein [Sphingobacteriales bacterium]